MQRSSQRVSHFSFISSLLIATCCSFLLICRQGGKKQTSLKLGTPYSFTLGGSVWGRLRLLQGACYLTVGPVAPSLRGVVANPGEWS